MGGERVSKRIKFLNIILITVLAIGAVWNIKVAYDKEQLNQRYERSVERHEKSIETFNQFLAERKEQIQIRLDQLHEGGETND